MIKNIQMLRGFAAINVVIFHIIGASISYDMNVVIFHYLIGWGANGVDIFFVISGFVMLYSQFKSRKHAGIFLINRLIRIVPMYWMATFLIILLSLLFPSAFNRMTITPAWAMASLFFTSTLAFSKEPVIFVGWTLELEILFYIAFSIGLLINSWKYVIFVVSCSMIFISWAMGYSIIIEFIFGMLIAYIYVGYRIHRKIGFVLFLAGIIFLFSSLFPWVQELNISRTMLWGVPSFFLVLGAVLIRQHNFRIFSYLGDASYSIYLLQVFTIPGFYKFASFFFRGCNADLISFFCLMVSLCFSCLIHSYFERPILIYLRNFFKV